MSRAARVPICYAAPMCRGFRLVASFVALVALGSCSRVIPVRAVFVGAALAFVSEDSEARSAPWCWNRFALISDAGEPVWEFDAYEAYRDARSCSPNFPLAYGRAPPGAKVEVPPRPIDPGRLYLIQGHAGDLLEGAFVVRREPGRLRIVNLDPHSPEAVAVRGLYGQHRDSRRRATRQTDRADHEPVVSNDAALPRERRAPPPRPR